MSSLSGTLSLVLLLACTSCALGPQTTERAPIRGGSTLITQEEVRESTGRNAFEVVQFLRPRWLQKQGAVAMRSDGDVVVYLDRTRLGGPDMLRQVEKAVVLSIRFFDASGAQARFGMDHPYGAIQIVTERS